MSKFKNQLIVKVPLDGRDRELVEPLRYFSEYANKELVALKGMKTDYGSIPKILHSVLSPTGKPTYAYVIHDMLYQDGIYSKKVSDKILDEAMKILGTGWFKRKTIMTGLKIGGWVAWNKYRKKDK